jgi:hypothetical protein
MSPLPTLDAIGLKYGTDKASSGHDYLEFYDSFFSEMREEPLVLLEIGVFGGASLRMWEEYFPKGRIIGLDIMPASKRFERGRVGIELADQSNIEHLTRVALKHGPFDVIVDDGSHQWDHQIASLRTLFPFLKDQGLYIVEDLQTNYGAMAARYKGAASESCVEFLKSWMDLIIADEVTDIRALEDPFLRTYGRALEFMSFRSRACVMRKRLREFDWRLNAGPPLAPLSPVAAPIFIGAHLGVRGDVFGPSGYVDFGSDLYTVQGFAIEFEANVLEYRVRYPDNAWSEWTHDGRFAGTRGKSLPITGFTVRLADGARAKYRLRAFGRFVGDETPIEAGDGEDCLAPLGAVLRGLQVEIVERHG